MATFYIKQDDTRPELQAVLKDSEDSVVSLVGVQGVRFIMTPKAAEIGSTPKVDAAGEVVGDPLDGVVKYVWLPADTEDPGRYRAEFEVTFSGGSVETFPNSTYLEVKITADLGGTV